MANVRFYIDGLNLYYGALRKTPHRWLDIHELCRRVASPGDQINRIRYFTSDVINTGRDGRQRERQLIYLRALETIGGVVDVHKGRFARRRQQMELVKPIVEEGNAEPTESVLVYRTEEKGSDVNLATYLLLDAARREFQSTYDEGRIRRIQCSYFAARCGVDVCMVASLPFSVRQRLWRGAQWL